jgi:predicted DNA-binding antitoxin AbrB/MazE fold protein
MTQVYEAIYENGIFRPLSPPVPSLVEGQQVRIVVETISPDEIHRLAAKVYEGLSEEEIDEIERIAFDRSSFFTEPDRP